MNNLNFDFTAENVSKYWNLLNNSNNSNERKIANEFLMKGGKEPVDWRIDGKTKDN